MFCTPMNMLTIVDGLLILNFILAVLFKKNKKNKNCPTQVSKDGGNFYLVGSDTDEAYWIIFHVVLNPLTNLMLFKNYFMD